MAAKTAVKEVRATHSICKAADAKPVLMRLQCVSMRCFEDSL
jgi:hypothetical protein